MPGHVKPRLGRQEPLEPAGPQVRITEFSNPSAVFALDYLPAQASGTTGVFPIVSRVRSGMIAYRGHPDRDLDLPLSAVVLRGGLHGDTDVGIAARALDCIRVRVDGREGGHHVDHW